MSIPPCPSPAALAKPYRGWLVLAGGFVNTMIMMGATVYCFGLFVVPAAKEFGLSRADANNGMIAFVIGTALWAPLAGRLVDRAPVPAVMAFGGVAFGLGFTLISISHAPWLIALAAFALVALGVTCAGTLTASTVAMRWFRRRRGRALGITAVAASAGGFVMAPLAGSLITGFGWRMALAVLGLGAALLVPLVAALLVRSRPGEAELRASGEDAGAGEPAPLAQEQALRARALLARPAFWFIAGGAGMMMAIDQALLASIAPYLSDSGVSLHRAALLMSALTASAIAGKLLVGHLADRIDARKLFFAVAGMQLAFLTVLMIAPPYWILFSLVILLGASVGGILPIGSVLIASNFGTASFGTLMGWTSFVAQSLAIVALRFIGAAHDRTGSYNFAFLAFLGVVAVSAFLIGALRPTNEPAGLAQTPEPPLKAGESA